MYKGEITTLKSGFKEQCVAVTINLAYAGVLRMLGSQYIRGSWLLASSRLILNLTFNKFKTLFITLILEVLICLQFRFALLLLLSISNSLTRKKA